MCQFCEDEERRRVSEIAMNNPRPCLVCEDRNVVGVGTWRPDEKRRLAAGGNDKTDPIFAYWLCRQHAVQSEENYTLIMQTILRQVRVGKGHKI